MEEKDLVIIGAGGDFCSGADLGAGFDMGAGAAGAYGMMQRVAVAVSGSRLARGWPVTSENETGGQEKARGVQ